MSSISSSAYSSVSSSSSNGGISGLMSGIDTDSLVSEMLAGMQAKIDVQNGTYTQTEWVQEMYRDVISEINSFRDSYFDSSYGSSLTNNLASSKFFDSFISSVSGSSAISVISTDSTASTSTSLDIAVTGLASQATLSTGNTLSSDGSLTGSVLTDEMLAEFNADTTLALSVKAKDGTEQAIEVDLSGATTITQVANRINSALEDTLGEDCGISVSGSTDGLSISVEDGASFEVNREDSDDLAIQFSGLTEDAYEVETDDDGNMTISAAAADFTSTVSSFTLTFDGVSKNISLSSLEGTGVDGAITADDIVTALQSEVKNAFGDYLTVGLTEDGAIQFSLCDDLEGESGHEIKITGTAASYIGVTPGQSSSFDTTQTLEELGITNYDFSINGVEFSFDADTTVSSMMSTINNSSAGVKISYSSISDSMTIEATSTGALYGIDIEEEAGGVLSYLFYGDEAISDNDGNTEFDTGYTAGTDATLVVNGIETSRSSNTFTIEGITMTATSVSDSSIQTSVETRFEWDGTFDGNGQPNMVEVEYEVENLVYETSKITTAQDVDKIVEGVASFVNDYNAMIEKLNGLIDADKTYKDYAPLSDAQKAEMTDSQIEAWEEKAKEGLLSNDSYISSFLSSMRSTMYTSCGDSGLALYQIGITTSSDYKDKGTLIFDEAAFRSALDANPDEIKDMFTNSSTGLASKLTTIMKNTANESSGSPGSLVSLVGVEGYSTESNNTYTSKLSSISSRISQLETLYNLQKDRYWSKFTSMETILNNYNTQASLFADYFG